MYAIIIRRNINNCLTDTSYIDSLYEHLQDMMGESNARKK